MEFSYNSFRDENALNAYPFDTDPIDTTSKRSLLTGIFVDASIISRSDEPIRVSGFSISGEKFTLLLNEGSEVLTASAARSETASLVPLVNGSGVQVGTLTCGKRASELMDKIGSCLWTFSKRSPSYVVSSCIIRLGSNHVTGISTPAGLVRGRIRVIAGDGIEFRVTHDGNTSHIRVDAVGGRKEGCCPDDYSPVKTINNVSPDEIGKILIKEKYVEEPEDIHSPRQALKIENTQTGIMLKVPNGR